MAQQTINIGNLVNDGLGDDLRTAFQKVNANFSDLQGELTITANNGTGTGAQVFKEKDDVNKALVFRRLVSSDARVMVQQNTDNISFYTTDPFSFSSITTNVGIAEPTSTRRSLTIQGGNNITVTAANGASSSTITIGETLNTATLLTDLDFGGFTGTYGNVIQFLLTAADIDFGDFTYPSALELDAGTL